MRIASADLVAATSDAEVLSAVNAAVRSMVGGTGPVGAFLVPAPVERVLAPVAGVLTIPLRSEAEAEPRALRFLAPRPELVELAPLLDAIADHAASALDRIALVNRIRQDEQDRYFRTLVMTSHDVTLISRDGRIAYGLAYGVGVSLEQLQQADMALYAAKAAGKGRWQQFERGMSTPLLGPLDYAPEG